VFVILFVIAAGCGAVTAAGDDAGPELAGNDAGALEAHGPELGRHDAGADVDACPPPTLLCLGIAGACPGGMLAKRSECGGAPFPVCCPANVCELGACEQRCPACP
jgi:hypothetical protein